MKISFPRHIVYVVITTILLIIFAIWFATAKLIPMGKEFRINKRALKEQKLNLQRYEDFYNETLKIYNERKTTNRHIIESFRNEFDQKRFKEQYAKYFIDFQLSKMPKAKQEDWYEVYEVNTTSKIKSPQSFYKFLEAINKSDWIIGVTFPINFERDGELIHSSFKMQVYKRTQDINATKQPAEETPKK